MSLKPHLFTNTNHKRFWTFLFLFQPHLTIEFKTLKICFLDSRKYTIINFNFGTISAITIVVDRTIPIRLCKRSNDLPPTMWNYFEYVHFIFTNKFILCLLLDVLFCYCLTHFVSWTGQQMALRWVKRTFSGGSEFLEHQDRVFMDDGSLPVEPWLDELSEEPDSDFGHGLRQPSNIIHVPLTLLRNQWHVKILKSYFSSNT